MGPSSAGGRAYRARDVVHARQVAEHFHGADTVRCRDGMCHIAQGCRAAILRRPMLAHAVHGDIAAQHGQTLGKGAPKSTPCARDERDLAFEQALGHVCCIPAGGYEKPCINHAST